MPFTLTMPKLSPTMEAGTLVKWHKKEGDFVNPGDVIIEVATDKATVEHEALDGGWLRKIILQEGQEANVNAPLAIFTEEKEESIDGYTPEGTTASPPVATKPEPAKNTVPAPAPQSQAVAVVEITPAPASATPLEGRILASPLAKKLAKDQGLDLSTLKGSGPSGRIMKRDLANAQPAATVKQSHLPKIPAGTFEEVPLTPIRKVIARRLQESKSTIPHFYVHQTIDAAPLVAVYEQLKEFSTGITYNDLIVKAVALTLKDHPVLNTGFDPVKNVLIQYKTIDICVAVSTDGGLITPIVAHADHKTVSEISAEVKQLAKRAKEGKLAPHEYQGGSFTISNMGMFGVTDFEAILNPPQSAILAVSGINDVPVVKNGAVVPGKTMNLTLSVDHRSIDGTVAARFIRTLQHRLERPAILLV